MNKQDNTAKLERNSTFSEYASLLKGQIAVDAAKHIESDIQQRFGVFVEEYVSGIIQAAINKATADLRTQLAERDAQLVALQNCLLDAPLLTYKGGAMFDGESGCRMLRLDVAQRAKAFGLLLEEVAALAEAREATRQPNKEGE